MTSKEEWHDLIITAVERWVHNDDALLDLITEHLRSVALPPAPELFAVVPTTATTPVLFLAACDTST